MWSNILFGKCLLLSTVKSVFLFMNGVNSANSLSVDRTQNYERSDLKSFQNNENINFDVFDYKLKNSSFDAIKGDTFSERHQIPKNRFSKAVGLGSKILTINAGSANNSECSCENRRSTERFSWQQKVFKGLYLVFRGCNGEMDCYRRRIIQGLDRLVESKSVLISDGVFLVSEQDQESRVSRDSDTEESFLEAVYQRVVHILETHALRVRLGVMKDPDAQARFGPHRHYKHAFPLMVGSFMVLAAFLVPMGFQFLAVVGGKALVLSQIALVLAMGSSLQRFFGFGGQGGYRHGGGGLVQHDYYLRSDTQPPLWHRNEAEGKHHEHDQLQLSHPHTYPHDHHQQQMTQHQLQGLMNYQQN